MSKPRNSVLFLFDPLHQSSDEDPCTPTRDSSPDLGPSDKENDPGELTVFFNRLYTAPKAATAPRTPKGKLIDLGDTPAPAPRLQTDASEDDGSDADGEQSESDLDVENGCAGLFSFASTTRPHLHSQRPSSSPRMPFAELDVERTPRAQQPQTSATTLTFGEPQPLAALLAPAPMASPLADVVNSINFEHGSDSDADDNATPVSPTAQRRPPRSLLPVETTSVTKAPLPLRSPTSPSPSRSPFPAINVCPETPVLGGFGFDDDEDEEETMEARAAHLRPAGTRTHVSPDDPRRTSVDLYSSFHLQLQSEDMSFDLLNDRISFFAGSNGQDSFWAGTDATFDTSDADADASKDHEFDEISVPRAMFAKLEKLVPVQNARPVFHSTPPAPIRVVDFRGTPEQVTSPTTTWAANVPLPMSPTVASPPSKNATPSRAQQLTAEPPSPPTTPIADDEESLMLECELLPPPVPTAPIPALRIVKKAFRLTRDKSTSVSTAASTGKAEKKRQPLAPTPVAAPQSVRAAIRGVQRPPASIQGSVVIGLPPSTGGSSSTSSSSSGASSGAGARTASIGRFAGIQRPTLAAKGRTVSTTARPATLGAKTETGIRRPASVVPKTSAAIATSRSTAPASSGLPKPASKLPGPRMNRAASLSGGAAAAGTGAAVARPKAFTLSRATGRF
ncbi:uncharacterized protein BXZ73DRAFT_96114 [Epithele typhae]|uniref:uncharacterized protein n=1 Tax=Epithele typhae TaxID=378194 RepID=UPI00200843A9|nr:uncharacterized protein BXZ73DRAFT_96114 [Epithele typhae]KAH9945124.1 hypothetical protein BXZ73DRAFT_96114 [Epithele typhae]